MDSTRQVNCLSNLAVHKTERLKKHTQARAGGGDF